MTITIPAAVRGLALIAVCVFAGCAAPRTATLPDGTFAYRIDCDGNARGLNLCLEKAGKSCGARGYTIVTAEGRKISTSDAVEDGAQALFKDYEGDRNSILIQCGT
ncbi:MAG: hypothetical protein AAFR09_04670 [Pseudomonadota bacterium]